MTDIFSPEKRSQVMSLIRSKDTKPELLVRKFLFSMGFRYRLHNKKLPGRPDIVLKQYKTVIFVHGCFWHGHENRPCFQMPRTRTEWWTAKITRNRERDRANQQQLAEAGWQVIIVWECSLKNAAVRQQTLPGLVEAIRRSPGQDGGDAYTLPLAA